MFPSFPLGRLFGFPVRVNLSFLLLLAVVLLWTGGPMGAAMVLMAAGSIVLHELGHALMARRLGVAVDGIELHFFGGAAGMRDLPRSPRDEIAIAAAGPAVSFALAGLGGVLAGVSGWQPLTLFAGLNLVLGAFNLLPVFPSDGGRILRALLARRRGLVAATELAVGVGRVLLVALAIGGVVAGAYQLVIVAGVLWLMGGAERRSVRRRGDRGAWRRPEEEEDRSTPPLIEAEYLPPRRATAAAARVRWPAPNGGVATGRRGDSVVILWRL